MSWLPIALSIIAVITSIGSFIYNIIHNSIKDKKAEELEIRRAEERKKEKEFEIAKKRIGW